MRYAFRSVFLRFCFAPVFCALAVPVKAMVAGVGRARPKASLVIVCALLLVCSGVTGRCGVATESGGQSVLLYVPLNDCVSHAMNVTVSGSFTIVLSNNVVLAHNQPFSAVISSAGLTLPSDAGNLQGMTLEVVGTPLSFFDSVQINATIGPAGGDSAAFEQYSEHWFNTIPPVSQCGAPGYYVQGPFPYYSHYGQQTCVNSQAIGCFPNEGMNSLPFSYTNDTATPEQITWNGNSAVLQPGQSTNIQLTFPTGTTGTFNAANQDPNDGSFDNPQLQNSGYLTNALAYNGSQWTNLATGGFTNFSLEDGADGGLLANGMGGVIWSNSVNAVPANNGTLQAGFQLLNNDMLANQAAANGDWSNFLSQLHNTNNPIAVTGGGNNSSGSNNPTSGTASNVWVMNWPSNLLNGSITGNFQQATQVWVQNWPTNINTNTALAMVWANTNQAGAIVSGASAQVGNLSGMVPNTLADNSGAAVEQDITITPPLAQQQVIIAMGVLPPSISTTFSQIRGVIAWFVCILLAIWNFVSLFRTIKDVSQVPQAQGPDTGAWAAVGANVLTAIVVASAIVAVISVLPVFAVGVLAGELTFANAYSSSSPLNFFNSMGWGFQFLSQYLPIYLMFTAFGVRVVYYFGLEVLAFFACIVIKLLIGV
jgi:hypothetical protein